MKMRIKLTTLTQEEGSTRNYEEIDIEIDLDVGVTSAQMEQFEKYFLDSEALLNAAVRQVNQERQACP